MPAQNPLTPTGAPAAGTALLDEHLSAGLQGHRYWPQDSTRKQAIAVELARLAADGVTTVFDTTTIECGRDGALLSEAAETSGLRVLCATGLGASHDVSAAFRALTAVELADLFITELTDRLPRCELRASAIVLESGEKVEQFDEVATLAASFAHAETGAPILLRAHPLNVVERVERLVGRGVDPDRILTLGVDDATTNARILEALARRGVLVGVTSIADEQRLSLEARCAMLAFLLRSIGPSRVCLGTGTAIHVAGHAEQPTPRLLPADALARFRERALDFGIESEQLAALSAATDSWLDARPIGAR